MATPATARNQMSRSEKSRIVNPRHRDQFITKDKAGLIYDALGKPYYDKIKSTLIESINSNNSSSNSSK